MEESWHSYPKIYNMGHAALGCLLDGPVVIQEKVDGSQLSFGRFGDEVRIRSRRRVFDINAADSLFERAADVVQRIAPLLHEGWTYRGEYLARPKHNVLAYDRTPKNHVILFDINDGHESYLKPDELAEEAERIGLDVVPCYAVAALESVDDVLALLDRTSCLGGQKVEGVVVKNYARFGEDGKVLMGKHVSERFKEVKDSEWKKANPGKSDVLELLCTRYQTEARWQKAVQHLREDGALENSPRDIAVLIREVHRDIDEECAEEIMAALYKWASKKIKRSAVRGMPEWYKDQLLRAQFEGPA